LTTARAALPHVALLQRLVKDKDAGVKEVEDALAEIAAYALTRENVARCRVACVPTAPSRTAREPFGVPGGASECRHRKGDTKKGRNRNR